jgi:hypothetical protein
MERKKSIKRADAAYLCRFRPEPEGGFTVTCPKLPPVITYGETLEEAQANAREAIELSRGDGGGRPANTAARSGSDLNNRPNRFRTSG